MGEPARPVLAYYLVERLTADRHAVRAAIEFLGRVGEDEKRLDELRAQAIDNLRGLDEGTKKARDAYDRGIPLLRRRIEADRLRLQTAATLLHRGEMVRLLRQASAKDAGAFSAAEESSLTDEAERAMGVTVRKALGVAPFGPTGRPAGGLLLDLWLHNAHESVKLYNHGLDVLGDDERQLVEMVNEYRHFLRLLPLEVDPRFVQSARRHSREMVEKGYFSHTSPTPGLEQPANRIMAAGFVARGRWAVSENIVMRARSARHAFDLWFDSPAHHRGMVDAEMSVTGVGRWDTHWTQHFGSAPRLMWLDERTRQAAIIKGEILPPQSAAATRPITRSGR